MTKHRPHVLELQRTRSRLAVTLESGGEGGDETQVSVVGSTSVEEESEEESDEDIDEEIDVVFNDDDWQNVKCNIQIQEEDGEWVDVVIYRHITDTNKCCVYFGSGEYEGFPNHPYSFDVHEVLRDSDGDEIIYRLKP